MVLSPECKENKIGLVFDIDKNDDLIKNLKIITQNENLLKDFQNNALQYGKTKKPDYVADLIIKLINK